MKHRSSSGFTIVEVIVVIVILGILVGLVIIIFNQAQMMARDTKRANDITSFQNSIEAYYEKNGEYPIDSVTFHQITDWGNTTYSSSLDVPIYTPDGSPLVIGDNTDQAQAKRFFPSLLDNFGDPSRNSNQDMFASTGINQAWSGWGMRYFYTGGAVMKNGASGSITGVIANFERKGGGGYFECRYTIPITSGGALSYVVGYYNEVQGAFVFRKGKKGTPITWNTANESRCNNFEKF